MTTTPADPLADNLTWYHALLFEIAPALMRPGFGRACATAVDDPLCVVATRMIARMAASMSSPELGRYCLQRSVRDAESAQARLTTRR